MGKNNFFQFKQFKIIQDNTAMKVGTDGVLLGAWTEVSGVKSILDIGTGTGLIALMMAQRTKAKITGIEIEKNAAAEAVENAQNSNWGNRINIVHISFQEFMKTCTEKFDLVISNPPFFINSRHSKNENLAIAKHNRLLSLEDLAAGTEKLLEPEGKLALILPVIPAEKLIHRAKISDLHLLRLTEVKPGKNKIIHRYLMEFTRVKSKPEKNILFIQNDEGTGYSEDYKLLTREFYLNF